MQQVTNSVYRLVFNSVEENCYILIDKATNCAAIVDPGCMNKGEEESLANAVEHLKVKPVLLLVTHMHFDHIWGVHYVADKWHLTPMAHKTEIAQMPSLSEQLAGYGIASEGRYPDNTIEPLPEDQPLTYGKSRLEVLPVPGHSPGHVAYYNRSEGFLLTGDALFYESIGRTDLLGGSYPKLIQSIQNEIFTLPDETLVLPGHGIPTSVGHEKHNNPFLLQ